jgi:dipeptidyl aminopeptidase/acylaminoacyl peptidase
MNVSNPTMIDDLFVLNSDGSQRQITNINGSLFGELNLTAPEEIWYTSFDGKKIQAWIQKPPDFNPQKKYPLILNIHGGPHSAYGWIFDHEFQDGRQGLRGCFTPILAAAPARARVRQHHPVQVSR